MLNFSAVERNAEQDNPDGHAYVPEQSAYKPQTTSLVHLKPGQRLFGSGDAKRHIYIVEEGHIQVRWTPPGDVAEVIEEVGVSMVFGLGTLGHQVYEAVATRDTRVSCWPRSILQSMVQDYPGLAHRDAEATHREFIDHRRMVLASTGKSLLGRLAAFLLVISSRNATEGKDPYIVDDTLTCDVVAGFLGTDIESLGKSLVRLERHGAIRSHSPSGIRLIKFEALESLAAGGVAAHLSPSSGVQ